MKEKTILIVGATGGIGTKLAYRLDEMGVRLVLSARKMDILNLLKKGLTNADAISCDVGDKGSIRHLFDEIENRQIKLDGMVYAAGICFTKPVKETDMDALDEMFRINSYGFYEMSRLFQSKRISNAGASIVGLSSYEALLCEKGMSAYAMTKAAMNAAVRVMAQEFAKRRIRVNAVLPAIVQSKMGDEANKWSDEDIDFVKNKQAYGVIPVEQVVEAIQYLLSDDAMYITGELMAISAGYHRG